MQKENERLIGYARVSSLEQNEDRQLIAMRKMGVHEKNIFCDKISGKNFERPRYQEMLKQIDENSTVIVSSIDRLGRNYQELNEQWRIITKEKKADIVILDMPLLDTRTNRDLLGTFMSDFVLGLLSYIAECEFDTIHKRQEEGIASARARGIRFGRPERKLPDNFMEVCEMYSRKELTLSQAANLCQLPKSTFYDRARKEKIQ